jgi:DNA gyrase/topoisomerase IV subunit B
MPGKKKIATTTTATTAATAAAVDSETLTNSASNKSIEETYQTKTQEQHILDRPDMYIGDIKPFEEVMFIFDDETGKIVEKKITYVPGLYKIFDEVLVNASDHAFSKKCNIIKVTVNANTGEITVWNNGKGIDVEIHKEQGIYVPELIFGKLLTSTNYDDTEQRLTGGRNGYGAKLTNVYSKKFTVDVVDSERKRRFYQEFYDNKTRRSSPFVEESPNHRNGYVQISFIPDYARFGMTLTTDFIALLKKRVYDIAGLSDKVAVYYNGNKIECKDFKSYMSLYHFEGMVDPEDEVEEDDDENSTTVEETDMTYKLYHEKVNDRWEVGLMYAPDCGGKYVSFVNGICTYHGGTHVDYIVKNVISKLTESIVKTHKDITVKPSQIKDNLIVFIKANIVNPSFTGQTKETMKTPVKDFGSTCEIKDSTYKKFSKSGILNQVITMIQLKDQEALKKTDGKKINRVKGIPKLEDANEAGKRNSQLCSLILTEGDSAKALAMAGRSVVGTDYVGIYPLKGKPLNVRQASVNQLLENAEICDIKKILGLEHGMTYTDTSSLRYGKIIIMADQDSVTGDTPLVLKNKNNEVEIKTIDDINTDFQFTPQRTALTTNLEVISIKEYANNLQGYSVWTDKGWTLIKHIMRHKTTKRMFRVLTYTGCIDVTEDHSLLREDGTECKPNECSIGEHLMHNDYYFEKYKIDMSDEEKYYITESHNNYNITLDEAYIMGLFFANGIAQMYKGGGGPCRPYTWAITNTNLELLMKAKTYLEAIYKYTFVISEDRHDTTSPNYKLHINKCSTMADIINHYITLLYDKYEKKRVPIEILNASHEQRERFFSGYCDGIDAKIHHTGCKLFDIDNKNGAMGLYYLCRSLGYEVNIDYDIDKPEIYTLSITKGMMLDHPHRIKKIIDLGYQDIYVYDLETENHHFQAGIGSMIVHNTDGLHIKGLLLNFIHYFWPSLLKVASPNFISSLTTPILKASRGKEVISFYSQADYEKWKETMVGNWNIKYYKGLATSTKDEAKEYFTDMKNKLINYYDDAVLAMPEGYQYHNNGVKEIIDDRCSEAVTLAFDKKRADARKTWLSHFDPTISLDNNVKIVSISDFINKEMIHFSNEDISRSIPSVCDGLKPSQRKVLFGSFKKNISDRTKEVKVAQLAGYIGEHTEYHHGEVSLFGTIVGMAQDFVGSNNINLLYPSGQFGTRLKGGKDHGAPRYIMTYLEELTRLIFRKEDDPVLNYLEEDGTSIEPEFYVPIIPMVLVNGAEGIGTGFSVKIPSFDPLVIINNLKLMIGDQSIAPMQPWYKDFRGTVIQNLQKPTEFLIYGACTQLDSCHLRITELPIGYWTEDYKIFLDKLENKKVIRSYISQCTDVSIDIVVEFEEGKMSSMINDGSIYTKLGLLKKKHITNMHLYSSEGHIHKYKTPYEIMEEFYDVRYDTYVKRKLYIIGTLEYEVNILIHKVRFIKDVIAKNIIINDVAEQIILARLAELQYPIVDNDPKYEYLLGMNMRSLTKEKIKDLENRCKNKEEELKTVRATSENEMWLKELNELEEAYTVWLNKSTERINKEIQKSTSQITNKKAAPRGKR